MPLNPRHVWHLSMRELEAQIDEIVSHCMIHGETGWPPHMGGMSTFDSGKLPFSSYIIAKAWLIRPGH